MTTSSTTVAASLRQPALQSPEFGLALGLVLGRFALAMQDLHYGYWSDDLELTPQNMPRAQARYTDELMGDIPADVRSILDVGCGAGNTALKLLDRGYEVDCVWRGARLIVELDSRLHLDHGKFERDRARDRALTIAGWRVVRVTWEHIHAGEDALRRDLAFLTTV